MKNSIALGQTHERAWIITAVNVPVNLCVGCGTATKAGDRRSVFVQSTDTLQNLYKNILPFCRDAVKARNKTITGIQQFYA